MPQPTGLTSLGNVILGASNNYAKDREEDRRTADQRKRQDELLGIQRQQQLSDVASQRGYQDERDMLLHKRALIDAYRNEGIWDDTLPEDEAMKRAHAKAVQLGLDKKYGALVNTINPATGKTFLNRNDMGNEALRSEAEQAFASYAAQRGSVIESDRAGAADRARELPGRIDADANRVASQLEQAQQQENEVLNQLQSVTQVINSGGYPSPAEIKQEAVRKATELKVAENQKRWGITRSVMGEHATPSQADIQAVIPAVIEDLRAKKLDSALASQEGLRRQLEGARAIRLSLVNQQDVLRKQGGYPAASAPSAPTGSGMLTPAPGTSPMAAPAGSPTSGFLQRVNGAPAAAAPATVTPTSAPTSQQMLDPGPPPGSPTPPGPSVGTDEWRGRNRDVVVDALRSGINTVGNFVRPSSWLSVPGDAPGGAIVFGPEKQLLVRQLQDRLNAVDDQNGPTAMELRRQIEALQRQSSPAGQSSAPGRPITPSASIFPSAPWWSSAA